MGMAKKRGGIAGFYDRNKKIIKPVATGLAGLFGTPALGAAVGAAFGGLDRPGKSGIGLDVMGAAKGGLSGYAAGSAGQSLGKMAGIPKIGGLQSAGSKLGGMFTGGAGSAAAAAPPPVGVGEWNYGGYGIGGAQGGDGIPKVPGRFDKLKDLFGKEGFIEQNKTLLSGIGKGVMGVRQGSLDQQAADATMAQRRSEFDATMGQRRSEFDKTYAIDAAQEADRKRREDELMAQRAAFRAMFTGTA